MTAGDLSLHTRMRGESEKKKQNMVKKTIGFSWGPAGTACSYWTGVRMSTLLELCGVDTEADDVRCPFFQVQDVAINRQLGSYLDL